VNAAELKQYIRDIPDFPKPGILFRDVTPLLLEPQALQAAADLMAEPFQALGIERVLGIESRGFLLGAPVALALGAGLALVRKEGKLPYKTHQVSYELEYGNGTVEMHVDSVEPGQRVLILDDLIATGGTAGAAIHLARQAGGKVVGCAFLIELTALGGAAKLEVDLVHSVLRY